jgi:hypothetical protein
MLEGVITHIQVVAADAVCQYYCSESGFHNMLAQWAERTMFMLSGLTCSYAEHV